MSLENQLKTLLSNNAWVRDVDTALRVVPSLGVDLPTLVSLTDSGERVCIPTACATELSAAVEAVLVDIFPTALSGEREPIHEAERPALLADPLVSVLAGLMAEASEHSSLSNDIVPVLTVTRMVLNALSAGSPNPELERFRGQMATKTPQEQAGVLASIAWSFNGRLAATGSMLARLGYPVRISGLARALLTTPLVLCVPAGGMQDDNALALAAKIADIDLPVETLRCLRQAVQVALDASASRSPKRPVDLECAQLVRLSGGNPLFSAGTGGRMVAMLPELVDAKELTNANIPSEIAAGLCSASGATAMGSGWGDVLDVLLRWEVLSALVSAVQPVRKVRGRWRVDAGALPIGRPWALLTPRGSSINQNTVVAIRLSALRARARHAAQKSGLARGLADRVWGQMSRSHGVSAVSIVGDHGIAIFESPTAALAFAKTMLHELSALNSLPMDGFGKDVSLPTEKGLGVGIATGVLFGGTDGQNIAVSGPALSMAMALSGVGPLEQSGDPLSIRHAALGASGFLNHGIALDDSTLMLVLQSLRERGAAVRMQGDETVVSGVGQDFQHYAFRAWWEEEKSTVAALSLSDEPGACELLYFESGELARLAERDATLQPSQTQQPVSASPSYTPSPSTDSPMDPFSTSDAGSSDPFSFGNQEAQDPFSSQDAAAASDPFSSDPFSSSASDSAPAEPAPPTMPMLMMEDDDDEDDAFALPPEAPSAPMMMDEDDDDEDDAFALPPEEPSAPMMMDDDDEDDAFALPPEEPSAPMMMNDDDGNEDDAFALPTFDPWEENADASPANDDAPLSFDDPFAEPAPQAEEAPAQTDAVPAGLTEDPFAAPSSDAYSSSADGDISELSFELDEPEEEQEEEPEVASTTADETDAEAAAAPTATDALDEEWEELQSLYPSDEEDKEPTLVVPSDNAALPMEQPPALSPSGGLNDDVLGLFTGDDSPEEGIVDAESAEDAPMVEDDLPEQATDSFLSTDIARMFQEYVVLGPQQGLVTFGLLDQQTIRDAHSYPANMGNMTAVYSSFLTDKMREGFVPQVYQTRVIEDVAPEPINMARLEIAYKQMLER